jgi:CTP-dependent riboflavin kinase
MKHETVYRVLHHARKQEKWVATEALASIGLHTTLLHIMQDAGHVTTQSSEQGKVIKLTLAGFKHAEKLIGGEQQ